MKGQWIGTYDGDTQGNIMVNIDELDDHYTCVAYLTPNGNGYVPASVAYMVTDDKSKSHKDIEVVINAVDPRNWNQVRWDDIKDIFPEGTTHSDKATINIKIKIQSYSLMEYQTKKLS